MGDYEMTRRKIVWILLIFSILFIESPELSHGKRRKKVKRREKSETVRETNPFEELSLCQRYWGENMCAKAVGHCRRAVEIDPEYAEGHYVLAGVYFQCLKDYNSALEHLRRAVEINPFFTDVHNMMGTVFLEMGREDEAIIEFQKVLNDQYYPTPEVAYFNIGLIYARKGAHDESLTYFKKVTELNSNFGRGWYHYGWSLENLDRPREALDAYEKALERLRDAGPKVEARIWHRIGICAYKLKLNVKALKAFEQVLSLDPMSPDARKAREYMKILRTR